MLSVCDRPSCYQVYIQCARAISCGWAPQKRAESYHSPQMSARDRNAAGAAKEAQSNTANNNHEKSTALARDKTTQCERFLTFARHIRDQATFALRSAGQHPSNEDKDDFKDLKQQWQGLLNNQLLQGAGEVLTEAFLKKAELELGKLDETDTAATQARVAWQKVVSLVEECKTVKGETEQVMAKMQSLLS